MEIINNIINFLYFSILLAIMSCTAFLSLWISNGAATGMMLPIIQAILVELIAGSRREATEEQVQIGIKSFQFGLGYL